MASYKTLIRAEGDSLLEYVRIFGKSLGPTLVPVLLPIGTSLEKLAARYPLIDFEGCRLVSITCSIEVDK